MNTGDTPDQNDPVPSEDRVEHLPAHTEPGRMPWWAWMVPGARRAHQMRNIQDGTREVMELVRSIQRNLEQQVEAQRTIIQSLAGLPHAVDGLRDIGKATEAQREMLGTLQGQMEANARSMGRFNDTLVSMDGTTKTIAEQARSSEAALLEMLRRAQRRMSVLTALLVVMIGAFALLAGFILSGGTIQRKPADRPAPDPLLSSPPSAVHPAPAGAPFLGDVKPADPVVSPVEPPAEPPAGTPAPPADAEVSTGDPVPGPARSEDARAADPAVPVPPPPAPPVAPSVDPGSPTPPAADPAQPAAPAGDPPPAPDTDAARRLEKILQELRANEPPAPPAPDSPAPPAI